MKKLLSIVLSVMLVCSLAAPVFADADALESVYASLTRKSLGADSFDAVVYDDLTLPTTDETYGSVITWSSDNEAVISSSGEVTRGNETKSVVLTANISVGESRGTKAFSFRVPGIFDENYNGFTLINEEFEAPTLSAKVENHSGSTLSQADGYVNITNTVVSRTNVYFKDNRAAITENVAVEFTIERTDKENEFTVFFRNQAGLTLGRITVFGESTNFGSVYLRHYVEGNEKLVNSVNKSELGSVTKYNVRLETDPKNDFGRVWVNGVHIGDINLRSSADISHIQIFKTAVAGDIEEGSVHALKLDNLKVSYLDDNYRSSNLVYVNEFDDDKTALSAAKEENGYFVPTNSKEKTIKMVSEADGGVITTGNVVVEFDIKRSVGGGLLEEGSNTSIKVSDNTNMVFRLMWYDGSGGIRFYHGTADAKTGSNSYYLIKGTELEKHLITDSSNDDDALSVKAIIDNDRRKFTLFLNGIQVQIGNYTEFDFYSASVTGVSSVLFQSASNANLHKLGAVRCYVPGTTTKPAAEATKLDYNAFDKKLNIRSAVDQTGVLLVAFYSDDELISVSPIGQEPISLKANEDIQIGLKSEMKSGADEIKVFLWSSETDSIAPLSKNISTWRISSN